MFSSAPSPLSAPRSARRRRRRLGRGDEAFGLIEVVIALFLLAVTVVPVTLLVLEGQSASTHLNLREEAANLATQDLQQAAYHAGHGEAPNTGTTGPVAVYAGGDQFEVTTTNQILAQGGANTVCEQPQTQTYSQVFVVSSLVTWGTGTPAGDYVKQTTVIAPDTADFAAQDAMEIVVPVLSYADAAGSTSSPPSPYETTHQLSVTLSCTGSDCGSAPTGLVTSGTAETVGGCAVFTDVYSGGQVSYTVTVTGSSNDGWVSDAELSDATTATGDPTDSGIAPRSNAVVATFQTPNALTMDAGDKVAVSFQQSSYPGSSTTAPPTPTALPVTAEPSAGGQFALGDVPPATSSFATSGQPTTAWLFPFRITSGSTNYAAWAGTWTEADPSVYSDPSCTASPCAPATPVSLTADEASTGSVSLPLYPLQLQLDNTSGPAVTSLSVTPLGNTSSSTPLQLNYDTVSHASDTSLPLGAYQIQALAGTQSVPLSHSYVWITPSGVCAYSSPLDPQSYPNPPSGVVGCDGTAGDTPGPSSAPFTERY